MSRCPAAISWGARLLGLAPSASVAATTGARFSHALSSQRSRAARTSARRNARSAPAYAQQFLAPFGPISDHFRPRRHLLPALAYHELLQTRFATWREVAGLAAAA
jgi:putative transposase